MYADENHLIENDIHAFLDQNQRKELLRFVTIGSVDDGKSTLIGRLLHDTKGVYDDQLRDASRTTATGETAIDFARITDGLRAEREQGITIDVAYRYFSTPRRKFIIADTPGHVQYTRNMATGASTAHVALILIDARLGVLSQSRRHAYISSLLGIPHLLVCVNKMDLVDFSQEAFDNICKDFLSLKMNFQSIQFVPVSALLGVNIVDRGERQMAWHKGPTVLQFLEEVEITQVYNQQDFRYPIQYVIRPNLDYRGYAGQIASGSIKKGDTITVMPSGKRSIVSAIDSFEGELDVAHAPMSITLRLEDELDISRGDMLVSSTSSLQMSHRLEAHVVWLSEEPLNHSKSYWVKHGTRYIHINIDELHWKLNMEDLSHQDAHDLTLNDIGKIVFSAHQPVVFDPYTENRATGAFIIIDFMTNNTVAAGMLLGGQQDDGDQHNQVTIEERQVRLRQQAVVLCIPTESQYLSHQLERILFTAGYLPTTVVGQDNTANIISALLQAGLVVIYSGDSQPLEQKNLPTLQLAEHINLEEVLDKNELLLNLLKTKGLLH